MIDVPVEVVEKWQDEQRWLWYRSVCIFALGEPFGYEGLPDASTPWQPPQPMGAPQVAEDVTGVEVTTEVPSLWQRMERQVPPEPADEKLNCTRGLSGATSKMRFTCLVLSVTVVPVVVVSWWQLWHPYLV